MHRSLSIVIDAIITPRQNSSGTISASVGQTTAHGMSVHITHACTEKFSAGVPAANPYSTPSGLIACTGHTREHSPHRVHAPRNAASGSAPGGRT